MEFPVCWSSCNQHGCVADGSIFSGHAKSFFRAKGLLQDSMLEMADPAEQWKAMPASLHLYVRDADEAYRRAL
jgi:hypothetical protein